MAWVPHRWGNMISPVGHYTWPVSLFSALAETDGIEPARKQFALLSEELLALLSRFGLSEGPLYKAWCPMAFDNRGASWIQSGEEISNPYFGEMMLRCGEIKEVLK